MIVPIFGPFIRNRSNIPGVVTGRAIENQALLAGHDLNCRGTGAFADHRAKIQVFLVLRPAGVVD